MLTRRRFIVLGIAGGAAGVGAVAGAVSILSSRDSGVPATGPTQPPADFSARFARFEAAAEPNGDLAKVVWPDFVEAAGADVKGLYEFQITHGDLMRYMPCFCGCGQDAGHRSNRDCYV